MKHIFIAAILLFSIPAFSDCAKVPEGDAIGEAIKAKNVDKSTTLLTAFNAEVKSYLAECNQSKEMFEQTNVSILMYEDNLADLKHDLASDGHGTDCSKVPSSATLEKAFKSGDATKIKALYTDYKTASHAYIEHCSSHAEYETVFESSTFCDEMYGEWEKKAK